MRAFSIGVFAATMLLCAPMAQAQKVDLAKTSCKEFVESGKDGIMIIWSWLYGYYTDEKAEPIVDFDVLVKRGQELAEYCKAHPDVDVVRAAQPIYDK
jgi:hypothetical protein